MKKIFVRRLVIADNTQLAISSVGNFSSKVQVVGGQKLFAGWGGGGVCHCTPYISYKYERKCKGTLRRGIELSENAGL